MRMRLTESEIRRIVRRRIVSQLLAEGGYDDALPSVDPGVEPFFEPGDEPSGNESGEEDAEGEEEESGPPRQEMQKKGEEVVEAIARIVGMSQAEWGPDGPMIGPKTGAAIKKHIDGMKFINRPFSPRGTKDVLGEWVAASSDGEIPDIEYEGGTLRMTPDEKGLLAYLFALTATEVTIKISASDLSGTSSYLSSTVDPTVEKFKDAIGYYTTMENLETVAKDLSEFVAADKTKKMMGTKLLLAAYAHRNTTFRESLEPIGYLAAIVGGIALFIYSGGFAAFGAGGAFSTGAAGATGFASVGAGLTAAWTSLGILGAVGVTTGAIIVGTATTWGLTESADLLFGSEAAIIKSYTSQYEQLDELANVVERTTFVTSFDRERRADLARVIRMIYSKGGEGEGRQSVLSALSEWRQG